MDYKSQLFTILVNPGKFFVVPVSAAALSLGTLKVLTSFYKVPWEKFEVTGGVIFLIGLIGFVIQDFAEFLNHKLSHKNSFYWDIHEVHHSANVLTPLTSKRHHPLFGFFNSTLKIIILGITQGALVWLLFKSLDYYFFMSLNVIMFIFNILGGNFRHSHIWISFGWFENFFISPAMHQIHHSSDPKHRNKNFGLWLSIWDRMFGSLYIPKEKEKLEFGLNVGVKSPHDTLLKFFFLPFMKMGGRILKKNKD
jgi:sterol desaturase/sphingolipid hydroxylase (fatty acid hydroxylase superfamily)